MAQYQVAVLVGSLRTDSINRELGTAMTRLAPPSLRFYSVELGALPMYNGDLEADPPKPVKQLRPARKARRTVRHVAGGDRYGCWPAAPAPDHGYPRFSGAGWRGLHLVQAGPDRLHVVT
jgi:hypothetical protein